MKEITCKINCEITVIQLCDDNDENRLMTEAEHAEQIRKMLGVNDVNVTNIHYVVQDLHPQTDTEVVETP